MDQQRFDDLARSLASGASRRLIIKGALAGAAAAVVGWARPGRGSAQEPIALGDACSAFGANAECSQAGTPAGGVPVICSDNGIALDGAYNCCRNAGGVCTADFQCCGAALCANGVCGGGGVSGLPLGSLCETTSQCSQSGGSVVCADNGLLRDGARNCCRNQGGTCTIPDQCCGALDCVSGTCGGSGTPPPSGGTVALGGQCTAASQCSQSGGAAVCADNGIASDGALNCCRNEGGVCANSASCCGGFNCVSGTCQGATSGGGTRAPGAECTDASQCSQAAGAIVCADNGYANDGALNCCRNAGGVCRDTVYSADCCGGLYCREGVCTNLAATGDLPPGSACTTASQCSQVGGAVVCASNGIATGGDLNCCRNQGGSCASNGQCCGGLTCSGGVCTGTGTGVPPAGPGPDGSVALGGQCTAAVQCSQVGGAVACADNGIVSDGALNCCRNAGGACTAANNSAGCCGGLNCVGGVCQ